MKITGCHFSHCSSSEEVAGRVVGFTNSKLVEKTVFVQFNNYLTVNGLHKSFQSAYKAHHSTETALLTITDDILLSLDRGTMCPIVIGLVSSI